MVLTFPLLPPPQIPRIRDVHPVGRIRQEFHRHR
jgi:hypothetical protein